MNNRTLTIKDVAAKCKVAHTTASDILNRNRADLYAEKTVAKVRKAAEEMGYKANYFASSLKSGRTNLIGIRGAGDGYWGLFHPYLANIYAGFSSFFRDNAPDYRFILQQFEDPEHKAADLHLVQERLVDGLLYIILSRSLPAFIKNQLPVLKDSGASFVAVHSTTRKMPCTNVGVDGAAGTYTAVRHLLDHGYGSVGFVSAGNGEHPHEQEMLEGFTRACDEAGLKKRDRPVYRGGGFITSQGEAFIQREVKNKNGFPRALFVCNDAGAYGMLYALREAGIRVPQDLAVIAFGEDVSRFHVKTDLAMVSQPGFKKGFTAAELLYGQMRGTRAKKSRSVYLVPDLHSRPTCGCK